MLQLTKSGMSYLYETWKINLNKNGARTTAVPNTVVTAEVGKSAQRLDNQALNALKVFYDKPKM